MATYFPRRYIFAVMAHLGMFIMYTMRANISVAMVAMVKPSKMHNQVINHDCNSGIPKNETRHDRGEFTWSESQQGLILSSFFYGYLFMQLPSGIITNKFGAKYVFGIGLLVTSILSLLTPTVARTNLYLLVAVRVLSGFSQGVSFPSIHYLISQWSPPGDRTRFIGYAFGGIYTGTVLSIFISGFLISSTSLGGWPSVFYFFGVLGIIIVVLWSFLVFDNPGEHPYISECEKKFLQESLFKCSSNTKVPKIPWFSIFTSVHVWAITVAHFANNWIWYLILTDLPSYFRDVLDFDVKKNGMLSALPIIATFIGLQVSSMFSDFLQRTRFSTATTRRIMSSLGFYLSALFLVLASYSSCSNITWSVACMILTNMFIGVTNSSFLVNHLDISPRFGAFLMGISNTVGTLAGCFSPLVTGIFINHNPSVLQYRKVFLIAAVVCVFGGMFFCVFLSGNVQPWNNLPVEDIDDDKTNLINKQKNVSYSTCDDNVDLAS